MRITVCELPHDPGALALAWAALCEHTARQASELVLLPELAMIEPVWQEEELDASRWGAAHVVGPRPVTIGGRPFNQGFLWSAPGEIVSLRRKFFLPDEPGGRETRW